MNDADSHSRGPWLLAALLAFPSCGFVQKYAGLAGVAAYVAGVFVAVWLVGRYWHGIAPWLNRNFRIFSAIAVIAMVVGFVVLHPFEDSRGPGKSSDRNEGLELAVARMTKGENPYYPPREFPGPLSVFPGSIVLSAPFAALGNSGYQNIFWLTAFLFAAARWFKDKALAIGLLVVPLTLSLAAQYEFVSGGDLIANGIFISLFSLFALKAGSDLEKSSWHKWGWCVLLGVGLASRANFILLTPLFGAAMWRVAGPRRAIAAATVVGLSAIGLTLPFYLRDPMAFTPLGSGRKLAFMNESLPWAATAMIGITVLASLAGAFWLLLRAGDRPITAFFRASALVTLTPIVCAVLLASYSHGAPDFSFLGDRFGLMYVYFALFGWGECWIGARSELTFTRKSE